MQIIITVIFFKYGFERSTHRLDFDKRRDLRKNKANDPSKNKNIGSVQVPTIISPANTESSFKLKIPSFLLNKL
jgi:hypothetical protein